MHFSGSFFCAEARDGDGIRFCADEEVLAHLGGYTLDLGALYPLRRPVTDESGWIGLEHTDGLVIGDIVELRNEYQLARANFPVVHHCRIMELQGNAARIEPPVPPKPALRSQQGCFLLCRRTLQIREWSSHWCQVDAETVTWQLGCAVDAVAVEVSLTFRAGSPEVAVAVTRRFMHPVQVLSERITFDELPQLREVYRKNRQLDEDSFQRRYNLDREGACFVNAAGRGLYVYNGTDATSIDLECPGAEFVLRALTPFRAPPNNIESLGFGDIYHYVSARATEGVVAFTADLARVQEVHAIRLHWYTQYATDLVVEALQDGGAWVVVARARPSGAAVEHYPFKPAMRTCHLRVTMNTEPKPNDSISLRGFDIQVGGDGFALHWNLDDHRDHRYCRYLAPELRTAEMDAMVMEMRSPTRRLQGDVATSRLRLHLGVVPALRPRLMHVPGGAPSLLVWTEHADRASLDSHRATSFGRSDITCAADAVGGFVWHGIPMSKSVFLTNPARQVCSKTHPVPQVSLEDSPEFVAFCQDLAARGYEICIHAPQPTNAPPAAGPRAAEYFARTFASRTWIDHSARVVHCGLSGQGFSAASPYFMGDAWRKAGFRYFWQFASEDAAEQRVGSINLQQTLLGDWLHTPLYWRHPAETGDFISWPTSRGGELDVYSDAALDRMIADWGVCISHTYAPAHYEDPSRSQYLLRREDGIFTSSPMLEDVLARFAKLRLKGDLAILTVRDAVDYWEAIAAVEVAQRPDGKVWLINRSGRLINGFTFVLRGRVQCGPSIIRHGRIGEDALITLDFPVSATLCLSGTADAVQLSLTSLTPGDNMASSPTKSAFDLTHGTDTDGTLRLSEFSVDFENVRYGMSYQPTNPQAIADAMAHFGEMPQDFTLVDMGSGKGRILIGAVEQGFRHVFGVEFVRELNEVARENISVRGIHNATLWTGDAAQYVFPPGNLLIYFGNPFRVEVMRAVIENLRTADYEKLYVVYRVPRCSAALDGCGFLTALGELPGWEGEYGVKTWRGDRV